MIYVARQNLISTAHVDLNCGKTASRAPQTGFFYFFFCHQSSGSSDSAVPQRAHRAGKTQDLPLCWFCEIPLKTGQRGVKYKNQKTVSWWLKVSQHNNYISYVQPCKVRQPDFNVCLQTLMEMYVLYCCRKLICRKAQNKLGNKASEVIALFTRNASRLV